MLRFGKEAYQVGISGLVSSDSNAPTPRQINKQSTKRTTDFSIILLCL